MCGTECEIEVVSIVNGDDVCEKVPVWIMLTFN